ncbi:MAG: glycosyltransferase [Elusimicrobia bacterium]|nr:glycosyltransferase [Candidatus Obscuribacterium magneticum]
MALDDYKSIVGESVVDELRLIAKKLGGRVITNVNSTAVGGGVAEILNRMVPLLKELGIPARWDVIKGGDQFYGVTKKIHNALHGAPQELTEADVQCYWDTQEMNLKDINLDADVVFIHDPQPAGLIRKKGEKGRHWVWRCHVDVSSRNESVWNFLKPLVQQYDAAVFSAPAFSQKLDIRQVMISPSIDPLSDKNKELEPEYIDTVLDRFGISKRKKIITQVSRFDYLKDPVGVIEAFRLVKPYVDCQLVLAGGSATDDPEGAKVLAEVREKAGNDPDIFILELPPTSNLEINALQRASTIVLQKSLKEGFGLTVSEALWKGKPVIAGAVGGIPLQITHKYSGILTHTVQGTGYWLKQLLQSPDYARKLGENGREHVRENFLLTRHLRDYMLLFLSLDHVGKDIVHL